MKPNSQLPLRQELFWKYSQELYKMLPEDTTEKESNEYAEYLNAVPYVRWIDIKKDSKVVGFLIIGTAPECHPNADYFILHAYVKSEYRRKRLAFKAISRFLKEHRGVYCLDIININDAAHFFWNFAFNKNEYLPVVLPYVPHNEGEGVTTYGFAPGGYEFSNQTKEQVKNVNAN